jgi:hypothetical protein
MAQLQHKPQITNLHHVTKEGTTGDSGEERHQQTESFPAVILDSTYSDTAEQSTGLNA